jgi:hypothetical protein
VDANTVITVAETTPATVQVALAAWDSASAAQKNAISSAGSTATVNYGADTTFTIEVTNGYEPKAEPSWADKVTFTKGTSNNTNTTWTVKVTNCTADSMIGLYAVTKDGTPAVATVAGFSEDATTSTKFTVDNATDVLTAADIVAANNGTVLRLVDADPATKTVDKVALATGATGTTVYVEIQAEDGTTAVVELTIIRNT